MSLYSDDTALFEDQALLFRKSWWGIRTTKLVLTWMAKRGKRSLVYPGKALLGGGGVETSGIRFSQQQELAGGENR